MSACSGTRNLRALGLLLLALGASACGDDDDDGPAGDAGTDDAGPWTSGTLTCAHEVMSDYATREYTFSDPFDRSDLGRFWVTDAPAAWAIQNEERLVVTGAGGGPGPLAMVADGQRGTDLVGWVDVQRDGDWDGAPALLCRADGPPVTAAYGVRILGDRIELFEQSGAGVAAAAASEPVAPALADDATVRVVLGCTADTVTGFLFAMDEGGAVGDQLACASWRPGDDARVGAFALTQENGSSAFDDVRLLVDP